MKYGQTLALHPSKSAIKAEAMDSGTPFFSHLGNHQVFNWCSYISILFFCPGGKGVCVCVGVCLFVCLLYGRCQVWKGAIDSVVGESG